MKSTAAASGVVVAVGGVVLRRVACILLLLLLLLVSETTTLRVQGKVEDKNNRVEAARESTRQTILNAVDKTGEVGEKIQYHAGQAAKDTATAAGVKVSEAADAARDTLLTAGQNTREGVKTGYDSATGTLRSAGEKASNAVGSAKERVLGNTAVENRDENEGVYGTVAGKYYDTATEKTAQVAEAMTAAAAQAGEKVQSNAYQTADTSRNTVQDAGSTIYDSLAGAGGKISQAADATKDSTLRGAENLNNSAAETLGSAREKWYDPVAAGDFYHPGMMDKLGNIAKVMGWHPVPAEQKWDLSKLSPYDIVIGNTMYEWHQKPQDVYLNRASNAVADSARNVGEKFGAARDYATQAASGTSETVRDAAACAKNNLWEDRQQQGSPTDDSYWDSATNLVGGAAGSVGEKLGSAGDSARQTASGASQSVRDATAHAKNNLWDSQKESPTGDSYWDIAKNSAAAAAAGSVGEKLGSAGDSARQTANAASQSVRDAAAHAKNNLWDSQKESPTGDSYMDIARNSAAAAAAGSVGEKLGSAGDSARQTASGASQSVRDAAAHAKNNLWDSQKESPTGDSYWDIARNLVATAAAGIVGEKLGSAGEYANDKVNRAFDSIKDAATHTKNNLWDSQINSGSKDGYIQDTTDSINNAATKMGENLDPAGSQAAETLGAATESMKEGSWDEQPNSTVTELSGLDHKEKESSWDEQPNSTDTDVSGLDHKEKESSWDEQPNSTDTVSGSDQKGKEQANEALGVTAAGLSAAGLGGGSKTGKELLHMRPRSSISSDLTRFVYLITFATIYGSAIWMTFVSGIILSKSIPRQQFGYVQTRIFPLYLKFVAIGDVILFVLYSFTHPLTSTHAAGVWQLVNLLLVIMGTVFNVFILEPQTTKLFVERLKLEKEEGRGLDYTTGTSPALQRGHRKLEASKQQFKELHGYSTILNLASVVGLTLHAWHLAHHLAI